MHWLVLAASALFAAAVAGLMHQDTLAIQRHNFSPRVPEEKRCISGQNRAILFCPRNDSVINDLEDPGADDTDGCDYWNREKYDAEPDAVEPTDETCFALPRRILSEAYKNRSSIDTTASIFFGPDPGLKCIFYHNSTTCEKEKVVGNITVALHLGSCGFECPGTGFDLPLNSSQFSYRCFEERSEDAVINGTRFKRWNDTYCSKSNVAYAE